MGRTALQKQLSAIGRKGGKARAEALSKQRRKEIAAMGGKAPRKPKTKAVAALLLLALASPLHAQTSKRVDLPSMITLVGGNLADNISTTHALNSGRCHETNPFLGPHPSGASLYLNTAFEVGSLLVVNILAERSGSKRFQAISRALNYGIGGVHGAASIHNVAVCG